MDVMVGLSLLYAGIVVLNVGLSALLWWNSRHPLHRGLLAVWAATMLGFVSQGATATATEPLTIVLGFAPVVAVNLALASLLGTLLDVRVPWRSSAALFGVGVVSAIGLSAVGAGFTAIALPVCLAIVYPLVALVFRGGRSRWQDLSTSGRVLLVTCLVFNLHNLDFAVLRPLADFAAAGLTVAILIVFALSVSAPAVVMERTAAAEAQASAEMDVARLIQSRLMSDVPADLPGLEVAAYARPADAVGGDYYDIHSDAERDWILLGDVTGHGLGAGLVMLMAHSVLSALLTSAPDLSPAELNFRANRVLHRSMQRLGESKSMTIVAVCRDRATGEMVLSGDHDSVLVHRRATGAVEEVEVGQVPHALGFMDEFEREEFGEDPLSLAPGDLMLLATDGISEAARGGVDSAGHFSDERIIDLLTRHANEPLPTIRDHLVAELEAWTEGTYLDDVTFLLVRAADAA